MIIVAAGSGRRFDSDVPKQFHLLNGIPILSRTLSVFEKLDGVSEMVLVLPQSHLDWDVSNYKKVSAVISGGAHRQESVYKALRKVNPEADKVLVHDGVRPFVSERLINAVIENTNDKNAAVAGVPATDTIKQADKDGWVTATPDRDTLWNVQTPQGFSYKKLLKAHEQAIKESYIGTDDSMLVEHFKLAKVRMVEGERNNIKITAPEDILYGEAIVHICGR